MRLLPLFQSMPPRGGQPEARKIGKNRRAVSIHAPAWGATKLPPQLPPLASVSIHAPAWGATANLPIRASGGLSFNPCPRVGGNKAITFAEPVRVGFQSMPPRGGQPHPVE